MASDTQQPHPGWIEATKVYLRPAVFRMLFLGFSAGLPLLLVFGTLSVWLTRAGIDRSTVTYFSWAALAYSFKFVWAPLIDKLPLPVLNKLLGHRRSWLLVTQCGVVLSIILMAMIDPVTHLHTMAFAAVLLGLSAASQDIVIDAYRIESQAKEFQAAMSAMYNAGYRIGMLVAGALALKMTGWFGGGTTYDFHSWQVTYFFMAMFMLVGVVTTLLITEPPANATQSKYVHTALDYLRFVLLFAAVTIVFVITFTFVDPSTWVTRLLGYLYWNGVLAEFLAQLLRLLLALGSAIAAAWLLVITRVANRGMVQQTYIDPVMDFFRRYRQAALLILLVIGFYRISDIVLGVIANVFYVNIGFTEDDIANYSKSFGLVMAIAGGFIGGVMTLRFGVMRILLLGAILTASTNLLFMLLAEMGKNQMVLALVIAADNLSAGIAGAAFIAYLSGLTSINFTAMQYAIFSSLMTLIPKVLGGYSGGIVNSIGYSNFFLLTALLGVPVILLLWYLTYRSDLRVS